MQNYLGLSPAESWPRTSANHVVTNAHIETLRDVFQFPMRRQRNKTQAIKSGSGFVRAAWRMGIQKAIPYNHMHYERTRDANK